MKQLVCVVLCVLGLVGCSCRQQPRQITETRSVTAAADVVPGHVCPGDMPDPVLPPSHPPISRYRWELPDKWLEQMPTPLRIANFTVAYDHEVECYLTVLTGIAGGVEANVNRWRKQMGKPALAREEVESLPNLDMLGRPSPYIEIEGNFTDMTGQQRLDYRMLAAICSLESETVFVKMTGPSASVEAERERFKAFCASLQKGGADTDAVDEENE